jgi:hypothetical protein
MHNSCAISHALCTSRSVTQQSLGSSMQEFAKIHEFKLSIVIRPPLYREAPHPIMVENYHFSVLAWHAIRLQHALLQSTIPRACVLRPSGAQPSTNTRRNLERDLGSAQKCPKVPKWRISDISTFENSLFMGPRKSTMRAWYSTICEFFEPKLSEKQFMKESAQKCPKCPNRQSPISANIDRISIQKISPRSHT